MEVKNDVSTKIDPSVTGIKVTPLESEEKSRERSTEAKAAPIESDEIKIVDQSLQRQKTLGIEKANSAISSLTKVNEDAKKLSEFVTSIDGIAVLAEKETTTKVQREALQQESKELSSVIISLATELRAAKIVTVPEEAARRELERNLAEALEVFLPEPPRGPADLNVSTKEAIIQTRSIVSRTQAQIDKLRDALKAELSKTVDYVKSHRSGDSEESVIGEPDHAFKTSKVLSEEILNSPTVAQLAFSSQSVTGSATLFK